MPTMTVLVDGLIPTAADFNGNFAALNAALGAGTTIAAYVAGDLLYATAVNTLGRRAIGSAGQILTVVGGIPDWQPAAGLTDQLTGLGLTRTSTTAVTVAVGAAASDDAVLANRALMSQTAAIQGNTAGTWVVGTSQNKLDAGSIGNNQWWHVFSILRPDTGVVDILFSQSPTAPTLPTNYTKQRRIGSFKTDGAAAIIDFVQDGDLFQWMVPVLDVSDANPGTAAVTKTLTVPTGKNVIALLNATITSSTAGLHTLLFSDLAITDTAPAAVTNVVAHIQMPPGISTAMGAGPIQVRTNTSAQVRYRCSVSDAGTTVAASTTGWLDRRGKG